MLKGRLGLETARIPHADRHGCFWLRRGHLRVEEGTLRFAASTGGVLPVGVYGVRTTIQDVIAAEGPRLPDVNHSQRHFNTGIVEHGRTPSAELINRANGIRQWIDYWAITTGRRASMTVDPH
jgi:hypothetical protein